MKTKQFFISLLFLMGIMSTQLLKAQNCHAGFTSSVNKGTVAFTNTSTGVTAHTLSVWSFGDATSSSYQSNPTHTFPSNGTYTVCLSILDSANLCSSFFCDKVIISGIQNPPCNAAFYSYPDSSSQANTIGFYDVSKNAVSWLWEFGDGTTSSQQHPVHTYPNAGTYLACLSIKTLSGDSCSICDTVQVNVAPSCQALFKYIAKGAKNVDFIDASTGTNPNTFYAWDFGDGSSSNQQNQNHTYPSNGTYNVCLTISDSSSQCYSTFCDLVFVSDSINSSCQALFKYIAKGAKNIDFIDASSGTNPNTFYAWDFGDGSSSNQQNPNHTYASNGTYNVCLTISDSSSQCYSTFCDLVFVSDSINSSCLASFYLYHDTTNANIYWAIDNSTGNNLSYKWSWGDGSYDNTPLASHTYNSPGVYTICLYISGDSSCKDTMCSNINVRTRGSITVNVIRGTTPVKEVSSADVVNLFPNPASTSINLGYSVSRAEKISITIFDMTGNKISEINKGNVAVGSHEEKIDISSFSKGVYFVKVQTGDYVVSKKFVVVK